MTILENLFFLLFIFFVFLIPLLASMLPVASFQSDEEPMDRGEPNEEGRNEGIKYISKKKKKQSNIEKEIQIWIFYIFIFFSSRGGWQCVV